MCDIRLNIISKYLKAYHNKIRFICALLFELYINKQK